MNLDDMIMKLNKHIGTDKEEFMEFLLAFSSDMMASYIDTHIIPEVNKCMNMKDVIKVLQGMSKSTSEFSDLVLARMNKKAKLEKEPTIEELRQDYIKKSMTPELKAKLKLFKAILKEQNQ